MCMIAFVCPLLLIDSYIAILKTWQDIIKVGLMVWTSILKEISLLPTGDLAILKFVLLLFHLFTHATVLISADHEMIHLKLQPILYRCSTNLEVVLILALPCHFDV